ncbi:N-acetyltransferase family protein [Halopenitus sp. H-Gu1]|uniref:GNAT family N-acetyltransferase n=1 Tax=Halopenitus sp. H-Gu1 TaxID=3242697 RepID=UPI00359CBE1E
MHVRPARPGDAEALRAAVSRTGETAVFDDREVQVFDVSAAGVREAAVAADCGFLVEVNDRPVGLALAHPDRDGTAAELLALWVHPEHAETSVERKLIERVARALHHDHEGIETLRVTVPIGEPAAMEFYRANGFDRDGTRSGRGGEEVILTAPVDQWL